VGLLVSFIPGVPHVELNPEVVLALVLPPLLYSASLDSSYLGFRANLRAIAGLAVVLVLVTTVVIGYVAYLLIPDLPLTSALILGAVIAPPDAVAAVSIGRRLGLPRRMMTVLSGESLVNDATALTAYKVAIAAAIGTGASWGSGLLTFAVATIGGVLVGLLLAYAVHAVRMRLNDPVLESALGMLVPFGTYLAAESVHASGVLAVVTAGLYLGHHAPAAGYATRLQETAVWRAIDVLLESVVFGLIGLQLPVVLATVRDAGHLTWSLAWAAVAVLAATIAIRMIFVFPMTYLPDMLRRQTPQVRWQIPVVVGWAGMRGVVSLAAAFAVPFTTNTNEPLPGRDVVLLLAFAVTVGTLLLNGMTLPWLIRRLGVRGTEGQADALAEAQAQHNAAQAAVDRLDAVIADGDDTPENIVTRLRTIAEHRGNAAWERLGRQETESPAAAFRRLRRVMLTAEREVFVTARDSGEIDDEVLRKVLRELDLEEAALARE
jgi:CPA1 family monovalent cation:H+ antiporter